MHFRRLDWTVLCPSIVKEYPKTSKMSNPTPEQMDTFLTFLEEHRDLARGYLRNTNGRYRAQLLWSRLTDQLNAMGGCKKTVKQWQKVWADKKYLTKKAACLTATTSDQPATTPLTPLEQRIVEVIKDGRAETSAYEPAFPKLEEGESRVHTSPSPESEQQRRQQNAAQRPRPTIQSVPVAQHRKRRRIDSTGPGDEQNVTKRLFRMEERRLAADELRNRELSLIRQAVHQLSRVLQDGLQELVEEMRTWRK